MRSTVRDVAHRARVSPKTVSNVVNGTFPVSPETRRRVEDALRELDYVPNLSARGLRNGRTGAIALALPDLDTPYSASVVHAFVEAASKRQLTVQIEEAAGSVEREAQLLSRARAQLVDGLVLSPVLLETSAVQPGIALPPVVMIGEVEQPAVDHLWVDNVAAVRELTELLLHQGHRTIALLGAVAAASYRLRARGYGQALAAAGLADDPRLHIAVDSWTAAAAVAGLRRHLVHHALPDAIVCCTDTMAMGVLNLLWSEGYRIPDDISVVGYDDIPEAAVAIPPITTVRSDRTALAETALDLLARRIAEPDRGSSVTVLPYQIVLRQSTGVRR